MSEFGALSVLPPVLALGLAIKTRQVYVSLFVGIWLGWTIMSGWNPVVGFAQSVEALVGVFADRGQALILREGEQRAGAPTPSVSSRPRISRIRCGPWSWRFR